MPTQTWPFQQPYATYAEYRRADFPGYLFVHSNSRGVGEYVWPNVKVLSNNKDWKLKIHNEVDAGSGYKNRQVKCRPPVGYVENRGFVDVWKKTRFEGYGSIVPYVDLTNALTPEADDVALRDLALKRLKQKLGSRSNQVNLLIPAVELREMRGLLRALALSATDMVRALIVIKKSKGASAFQYASHAWLTWSFAVKPTVLEIQEVAQSIETFMAEQNAKFTDYGASKKQWVTRVKQSSDTAYGTDAEWSAQLLHTLSYRYTCGYHPKVRSANDYGYGAHYGLEFGAMVPALWELTPFSWLWDYFGTMGDYLEDVFVSDSVNTIYVNLGRKYSVSGSIALDIRANELTTEMYKRVKNGAFDFMQFDRSILSQLPTRQLRFKTTDEIGKSAVNKLLNLSSVLVGSRGKYFKTL